MDSSSAGTSKPQNDEYYMRADVAVSSSAPPPTNPGSRDHPQGCKPCNKYNPARPLDSCKHGNQCDFCHCTHERPKHRGQRGRHALQRRQYLEARDEQPRWFVELVDQIYSRPHQSIDEVKRRLQCISSLPEREDKVSKVLLKMRDIGVKAQQSRPDSNRLRGAMIDCGGDIGSSSVTELDGRCKWLVGTLHLMVRKMWESKESEEAIGQIVRNVLSECDTLPQVLDDTMFASWPHGSGYRGANGTDAGDSVVKLPPRYKSLENTIGALISTTNDKADVDRVLVEKIEREFQDLADTTASMNDVEKASLDACLRESVSVDDLFSRLKDNQALDSFKERLLGSLLDADTLEDCGAIQSKTTPSHEYEVRWKGGVIKTKVLSGSLGTVLREQVAEALSNVKLAESSGLGVEDKNLLLPEVHVSQVHLGVFGLSVELDYHRQIPEAIRGDLQARVAPRNWQDILNSWSPDSQQQQELMHEIKRWAQLLSGEDQENLIDFCQFGRLVGLIDVLQRRHKSDSDKLEILRRCLSEGATPKPAAVLRTIQQHMQLTAPELKMIYKLLGEFDARHRLKLDVNCKFLEPTIDKLTQVTLYNGGQLSRMRRLQDEICYECESLPRALEVLESDPMHDIQREQELLLSSPSLEKLRDNLRVLVN